MDSFEPGQGHSKPLAIPSRPNPVGAHFVGQRLNLLSHEKGKMRSKVWVIAR